MKLDTEFIRLPYRFDVERLAKEVAQLPESIWIPHPDNVKGNLAVPLISLDGEDNNYFNGEMKTTPHLGKCEYIQQVIASFGEVFGRSRLMRLEGNCDVSEHADGHYHWHSRVRIHVPIITYPEVIFYCGDQHVHMEAGECWIFNAFLKHRVVNPTPHTRIHLVIDTTGSSAFWDTIAHSEWPFKPHNNMVKETSFIPYQPGKKVEILTEKYNVLPVMVPGELEALTEDLIADYMQNKSNQPVYTEHYTKILRAFCKDWRQLWLLYAFSEAGLLHYDELLRQTMMTLKAVDTSIFLNSNPYEVRQLFVQRVLSVALCPNVRASVLDNVKMTNTADALTVGQQMVHPVRKPPINLPIKNHEGEKVGRNDLCHCGSGKKFKHCHGSLSIG